MKTTSIRKTISALMAAAVAVTSVMTASAEGITIVNDRFEDDIWADGSAWTVETDWDSHGESTVKISEYNGVTPESGSTKALELWSKNGGVIKINQTINVPAGEYTLDVDAMGGDSKISVAVGSQTSEAVSMTEWDDWHDITLDVSGEGEQTLSIIFDANAGGWAWVDGISVTTKSTGGQDTGDSSSQASQDNTSSVAEDNTSSASGTPSDSSSETKTETSSSQASASSSQAGTGDSKSDNSSKAPASTVPTTVQNGDFETYSETELAWWTVDWKDELKIWFADAEKKNQRSNKTNNYLDIWAEKAAHLSMKQTVHLKAGTYGIKFNMDANEDVDTGVKVKVGSLVDYTLPKGVGWDKWNTCETPAFTVTQEGDYDIEFYGDLKADTWLALDNITLTDGKGSAASSSGSGSSSSGPSNNSGSSSSSSGAAGSSAASSAADTANAETGAADTAAALLAVSAIAAAGMVVSKKKSR